MVKLVEEKKNIDIKDMLNKEVDVRMTMGEFLALAAIIENSDKWDLVDTVKDSAQEEVGYYISALVANELIISNEEWREMADHLYHKLGILDGEA